MKILTATPINEVKDYSMKRWLASVSQQDYSTDLLLVDNSENKQYVKKVQKYCDELKLKNYKITHIKTKPTMSVEERLAISRELIRQEVLLNDYEAWFSWECDIIIPPDTLSKLVEQIENLWVVAHAYPNRMYPDKINAEFGITLIKKIVLEKFIFTDSYKDFDVKRKSFYSGDAWFNSWMIKNYDEYYAHIYDIVKPIYHLKI